MVYCHPDGVVQNSEGTGLVRIRGVGAWKNGIFPSYGLQHADSGGRAYQRRCTLIVSNEILEQREQSQACLSYAESRQNLCHPDKKTRRQDDCQPWTAFSWSVLLGRLFFISFKNRPHG